MEPVPEINLAELVEECKEELIQEILDEPMSPWMRP